MYKKMKNPMAMSIATFKSVYDESFIVNRELEHYDVCEIVNKNRYSYAQAHKKIQDLKFTRYNRNKVILRMYQCPFCHDWHLTSCKEEKREGKKLKGTYKRKAKYNRINAIM